MHTSLQRGCYISKQLRFFASLVGQSQTSNLNDNSNISHRQTISLSEIRVLTDRLDSVSKFRSMASDRELVLYACVADGATIIADFIRDDSDLEILAMKCLHHTPPNHAVYSHTVDNRSYVFLIGERFVLFGVFDEELEKGKRLWLLEKMRDGFEEILVKNETVLVEKLGYKSLQSEMGEVFRRLLDGPIERISSVNGLVRLVVDEKAKNVVPMQLVKGVVKKKKRGAAVELNGESRETNSLDDEMSKESLGFVNKHGNGGTGGGRQRAARSSWRKRAWIVLFIDVIVCLVLFGCLYAVDSSV